jgi:tripartite-type tricarboxylate transporter receptor subunit TctC
VNAALGVKSVADLALTKNQVVIGGLSPGSSRDLRMLASLEALGIRDYRYVVGYTGTQPARLALLRNEVNLSDEAVVAIAVDLSHEVKAGRIIPLMQTGLMRHGKRIPDPSVPSLPIAQDAIVAVKGESVRQSIEFRGMMLVDSMNALGRAVLAPPGIEPDAGKSLRYALGQLNKDPQFQEAARRLGDGPELELISGSEAQDFAQEITVLIKSNPGAISYLEGKVKK